MINNSNRRQQRGKVQADVCSYRMILIKSANAIAVQAYIVANRETMYLFA
jgi:hypothetical protein